MGVSRSKLPYTEPADSGGSSWLNFRVGNGRPTSERVRFDVKLEMIDAVDARVKKPKILEKHSKAPPPQYPNLDEDEW